MKSIKMIGELLLSLWVFQINAQQTGVIISGKVTDAGKKSLEGVSVVLKDAIDSIYVSGAVTDSCGIFVFPKMKKRNYVLEYSLLGYKKQILPFIPKAGEQAIQNVMLEEDAQMLSEVMVTGKRTFMKMGPGTTSFSMDVMVASSQGNVLDALRSLPGVMVNEDGAVILNGQSGIKVLINGKSTYLSRDKLVNYLRSLPVSSIKDIQLITAPSAKYEAEGKTGLIDIRTQKVMVKGWTVQVNAAYKQSNDGKWNAGGRLTYQKNKFALFLDYSYNKGKYKSVLDISRKFDAEILSPRINVYQQSRMKDNNWENWGRIGMNYDFNNRLSFEVSTSGTLFDKRKPGNTASSFLKSGISADSCLYTRSLTRMKQKAVSGEILLTYKDEKERMADLSFDYLIHKHRETFSMFSEMKNLEEQILRRDTLGGDMGSDICMYSTQMNWSMYLSPKIKFDSGVKLTWVDLDNKALYANRLSGMWVSNNNMSNLYEYNENINAAYLQLTGRIGKFSLVAGLRLENTRINGVQQSYEMGGNDSTFKDSYIHLFPSLTFQYELSEIGNSISFLYNRRIVRPNYGDLSPFNYIWDDYTRLTGNPNLRAELTDNIELTYIYKKKYRAALFFSYTKAPIMQSIETLENNVVIVYPKNFKNNSRIGLKLDASDLIQLKWWRISANATLYHSWYKWEESGRTIEKQLFTPSVSINNQFFLPAKINAELTGFYNGHTIFGQAIVEPLWSISVAIQKKIWQDRLVLRLFANDLFQSNRQHLTLYLSGNIGKTSTKQFSDYRCVGLSVSINFNQGKQSKKNIRDVGIDQRKRINL